MPSINKINSDFEEFKHIIFENGATLDGPMLTQTLTRLRKVETLLSNTIAPPPSALQTSYVLYTNTTSITVALTDVLIFSEPITITSSDFLNAINGTVYRFGNLSNGEIIFNDSTKTILHIVPGEFVNLLKINNNWIGTFGP